MNSVRRFSVVATILLASCSTPPADAPTSSSSLRSGLQPVSAFVGIRNDRERSAAYFVEAGRVIQHPRCLNCHPVQRMPTQGDDLHAHVPTMQASESGHGVPALQCNTCHQAANVVTHSSSTVKSIPGHPHWALAPASMSWQTKSLHDICEQIKDPARNGGRSLDKIHEHMAQDSLVGWAWHPGDGRAPAPGTQHEFGELVNAWVATGAVCPAG